jgi:hypothetical protein
MIAFEAIKSLIYADHAWTKREVHFAEIFLGLDRGLSCVLIIVGNRGSLPKLISGASIVT